MDSINDIYDHDSTDFITENYNELEHIFNGIPDIEFNLPNIKKVKTSKPAKVTRERQNYMNKAAKKCRDKKKEIFVLMEEHIKELHKMINDENLNHYNKIIYNYNENVNNIKKR